MRELLHKQFGDQQAKHPIAQELELLVVVLAGARMRQRALQQRGVAKRVAECLAQFVGGIIIRQV